MAATALPNWPAPDGTGQRAAVPAPRDGHRPLGGEGATGTVYGGSDSHATVGLPTSVDTSGSLTGHILAQGWTDTPTRKSDTRVVMMLLAGLGFLVAIGLLIVFFARDVIDGLFGGLLNG